MGRIFVCGALFSDRNLIVDLWFVPNFGWGTVCWDCFLSVDRCVGTDI